MSSPLPSFDPALQDELQQQRYRDLIQRSWPGILIYPLIWWTLVLPRLWYMPTEQNFTWLGGIGALMLACAGVRVLLLRHFRRRLARQKVGREWELSAGLALCAGLWGLATALSLMPSPLEAFTTVLLAATAGICAGGIASLAISAPLVFLFLGCMLTPSILVILLGYSSLSLEFASVLLIFWIGMYWVSNLPRNEYHRALISTLQLTHQAAYPDGLTYQDSLTGLHNRRHFDQLLEAELKRAIRNRYPLSLLLVDLDHFKAINDSHGHLAGDECLKAVAQVLKSRLKRATDEVARIGGEEFAVVLPGTAQADARQIAEMLLRAVGETRVTVGFDTVALATSVGGISLTPTPGTSPRDFLKLADDALHEAKRDGRNCIRFAATS